MMQKMTTQANLFFMLLLSTVLMIGISACSEDNEQPKNTEQTGGNVSLRVLVNGYQDTESSLQKSANIEGSTILDTYVHPLNDEVSLVATLETEASTSTKAIKSFSTGTKIRVIAVKTGTTDYVSKGDFTVGGADSIPNFHVPVNQTYDFYFVSYNSTDSVPSDTIPPFENISLGKNDFLFAKVTKTITASDRTLSSITLKQSLARVALKFDNSVDGIQINSLNADFNGSYNTVTVGTDGSLSNGSGTYTANYGWKLNYPNVGVAVSDTSRTVYVSDSLANGNAVNESNNNFYVHIFSIAFADTTWTGLTAYFNRQLEQGIRYTVNVTLARTSFAGSNIYWNGTNPTFDNKGVTTHESYQGLLFKWGSLWGISPVGGSGNTFSSATTLYKPTSGTSWSKTTTSSWDNIPYLSISGTSSSNDYVNMPVNYIYANTTDNYSTGIGDICRFLADNGFAPHVGSTYTWRMPTASEIMYDSYAAAQTWGSVNTYGWNKVGATWADAASTVNEDGTSTLTNGGTKLGAFFPASGMRGTDGDSETGTSYVAGKSAWYWTGSVYHSSGKAFALMLTNTNFGKASPYQTCAMPVRCVRIKKK